MSTTAMVRSTWALMFGMLLLMVSNGLQGTLLGVRGGLEEINARHLGFVMAGYYVGFLVGSKVTPFLLRQVGHVRVFAAFGSLVSAAFILYAAIPDAWVWFFLRVVVGVCFAGLYIVAESWLNDAATNETRGKILSIYMVVQTGGIVLGQQLLNLADPGGYGLFVVISVLVSLSITPILLSANKVPVFEGARPMTLRELVEASPLGCVTAFLLGGIMAAFFGMLGVYASMAGLSAGQLATLASVIYLGSMLFQIPVGWLSDHMDRRVLIILMSLVGGVASIAAFLLGDVFWVLLCISFVVGGIFNPLYGLALAYTNDYLERDQMASASAGLIFINGVGSMAGPVMVGFVMEQMGAPALYLFVALLMFAIGMYGIYRSTVRATQVVGDSVPYVAVGAVNRTYVSAQVTADYAIEQVEQLEEDAAEQADALDDANPADEPGRADQARN